MRRIIIAIATLAASIFMAIGTWAKLPQVEPSYAWTMLEPLGLREPATIDTTLYNYFMKAVPNDVTMAYATTGNLGAEGMNMIYFDRKPMSDFFFRDALRAWLPTKGNHKFYNTRLPMTLVSWETGGDRENAQDQLQATFSGNVNKRLQVGGDIDFIYSKGCYAYQAVKDFQWGLSSSYMGDRYEMQTFYNHYNSVNKENGGITNDLYITDPAAIQGGTTSIDPMSIPTRLNAAHNRMVGEEFLINNKYKFGHWKIIPANDSIPEDSVERRIFIPVSSVIWTFDYNASRHIFNDKSTSADFWEHTYIDPQKSMDVTKYWSLRNTVGISLIEGFHKYAKAGASAYLTHEIRRYRQASDTITMGELRPEQLSPYPYDKRVASRGSENFVWVGAQITKQSGRLLRYEATAEIGVLGRAAGEIKASGNVSARFKLWKDSVTVSGYGLFVNESAPYLMDNFVSNHFIWKNDFGKIRRFRVGGRVDIPFTGTHIDVGFENVQNAIFFDEQCLPHQYSGSVQVLSASIEQNLKFGIFNWNNKLTYQTSTEQSVIPMPKIALYSNMFLQFRIAKVLHVQLGLDCDYYTKYYAPGYQPATMSFYNQRETKVGNYPYMNVYANMKLKKARFFVMMAHVNEGLIGKNYFSMPHYPMNPRRFLMGVSVDFAN